MDDNDSENIITNSIRQYIKYIEEGYFTDGERILDHRDPGFLAQYLFGLFFNEITFKKPTLKFVERHALALEKLKSLII